MKLLLALLGALAFAALPLVTSSNYIVGVGISALIFTVAAASLMLANEADNVARAGGSGRSFNVISVTTPSIPSEPTNKPIKLKPVLFL